MTTLDPLRRDILDHFDVAAQGLHDTEYVELCKELESEISRRRDRIYATRRRIFQQLESTSGV